MSVQRAGDGDVIDYSDFRIQQLVFELRPGESDTNPGAFVEGTAAAEPLSGVGGLANNEVAELVAHRLSIGFNASDSAASGDQDVGAGFYLSGVFGANADDEDLIPSQMQTTGDVETVENTTTNASAQPVRLRGVTEGRIFEMFQASASLPFDDATNGTGGGMEDHSVLYDRNWRATTGRGPVLDQTDDVTFAGRADAYDNVIVGATFTVNAYLIWDVAEMSDAGRVFSVPV